MYRFLSSHQSEPQFDETAAPINLKLTGINPPLPVNLNLTKEFHLRISVSLYQPEPRFHVSRSPYQPEPHLDNFHILLKMLNVYI
jgi:hypothetical protein